METEERDTLCLRLAQEGQSLVEEGRPEEGIEKFDHALAVKPKDVKLLAVIYSQLGTVLAATRNYSRSIEVHERELQLARALGDLISEARICANLGMFWREVGGDAGILASQQYFEKQFEVGQSLDDVIVQCQALRQLGHSYALKGKRAQHQMKKLEGLVDVPKAGSDDMRRSIEYFQQCLEMCRARGDEILAGRLCGDLGDAYYTLDEFEQAVECFNQRIAIAGRHKDEEALRRTHVSLGNTHMALNNIDEAVRHYHIALRIADELCDKPGKARCYYMLGNAHAKNNEYDKAVKRHLRCLSLSRECCNNAGQCKAFAALGSDQIELGQFPQAAYFFAMNRHWARKLGDSEQVSIAHEALRSLLVNDRVTTSDGELVMDGSLDPQPYPLRLSASLRSLTNDMASETNSSSLFDGTMQSADTRSEGLHSRASNTSQRFQPVYNGGEFFELLEKLGNRRMDEQRAEFPMHRRESAMSVMSVSSPVPEKDHRRKSLVKRIRSSIFQPLSTSTPLKLSNMSVLKSSKSLKALKLSRHNSKESLHSLNSQSSLPGSGGNDRDRGAMPPPSLNFSQLSAIPDDEAPVFRVPQVPPRREQSSSCLEVLRPEPVLREESIVAACAGLAQHSPPNLRTDSLMAMEVSAVATPEAPPRKSRCTAAFDEELMFIDNDNGDQPLNTDTDHSVFSGAPKGGESSFVRSDKENAKQMSRGSRFKRFFSGARLNRKQQNRKEHINDQCVDSEMDDFRRHSDVSSILMASNGRDNQRDVLRSVDN